MVKIARTFQELQHFSVVEVFKICTVKNITSRSSGGEENVSLCVFICVWMEGIWKILTRFRDN